MDVPRKPGDAGEPSLPLPIETLRDWYVTVCGGRSSDLDLYQIGINREALKQNTTLDPATDRVRVAVVGSIRRPFLMDRFFEIVPLDGRHPEALEHSPGGEAVFPEGDQVLRPHQSPQPGQQVILNSVVRRLEQLPSAEEFARILRDVLRGEVQGPRENS